MDFKEAEGAIRGGHAEVLASITSYSAGLLLGCIRDRFCSVYLKVMFTTISGMKDSPGGGVWGEASDKVVYSGGGLVPVYAAGLLEYLGGRAQFIGRNLSLRDRLDITGKDILQGFNSQVGTKSHKLVVHSAGIIGRQDWDAFPVDDITCINLVLKEEGGYASLLVTVYYCPVNGSGTAILGQQRTVQVKGAQTRHAPYNLGEHAERHHNLQVGIQGRELINESGILKLFGLQDRYPLLYRIFLYGAALEHAAMTAHGFIGHGNHTYYIIVLLNKPLQCKLGKLGGSHKYYLKVFLFHCNKLNQVLLLGKFQQHAAVRVKYLGFGYKAHITALLVLDR